MEPMVEYSTGYPISRVYEAFKILRAGMVERAAANTQTHPSRLSLDPNYKTELRPVFLALGIEDTRYEVRMCLMCARPLDEI
jgi:hypothetical protein